MTTHKGSVNCCNKIRQRRACYYCGYPESEAAFPETPEPCTCQEYLEQEPTEWR